MPYIEFSDEQKEQANSVDLPEFLDKQGEKFIRSGHEYRLDRDHSVTVYGNEWYDHACQKGGGPVSFLQEFCGMNYQKAMLTLLDEDVSQFSGSARSREKREPKPFVLPPASQTAKRVYAYLLQRRHIDREVLTAFVREGLIYEDAAYHNAVFVGTDEHGAARHAHKRSTNSFGKPFRITVEGSDFHCAFHWSGTSGQLFVFEAPIDLLSYITLHSEGWRNHSYVALCGTSSLPMFGMLDRDPRLEVVHLCLDNDKAGLLACRRLANLVDERGLAVDAQIPVYKDWNADLCSNFQQTMEEQQYEQELS